MNKEQQQIIDEVYKNYLNHNDEVDNYWIKKNPEIESRWKPHSKEEFINKCKTNPEFSETWGLKIEERELVVEERVKWAYDRKLIDYVTMVETKELDKLNVPTKLITLTYNNKTIESYE